MSVWANGYFTTGVTKRIVTPYAAKDGILCLDLVSTAAYDRPHSLPYITNHVYYFRKKYKKRNACRS